MPTIPPSFRWGGADGKEVAATYPHISNWRGQLWGYGGEGSKLLESLSGVGDGVPVCSKEPFESAHQ